MTDRPSLLFFFFLFKDESFAFSSSKLQDSGSSLSYSLFAVRHLDTYTHNAKGELKPSARA